MAAHRERLVARSGGTANQTALEEMLAGYVVPASMAALVQVARSLARLCDDQPANSGLWARYQAALVALAPLVADDEDAELDALLAEIRATAPGLPDGPWESGDPC